MFTWQSQPIQLDDNVLADVRANEYSIALGFHNDRWLFDIHLDDERALAIAAALNEAVIQHRAMRSQS